MIPLVIHTFAAFGLAFVLGFAKISLGFREIIAKRSVWLISLLECPACLGFWIGLVVGLLDLLGENPPTWGRRIAVALFLAFYTVATNFVIGRLTSLIPPPDGDPR